MIRIIFIFFLFFNFSFSDQYTKKEKEFIRNNPIINVGVEQNWAPFDFVEAGEYKGIAKEYLSLIEKDTGLKFNYIKKFTWEELLTKVKDNKIDLLPILAKSTEREEFLAFTNKYITVRSYLFSASDKFSNIEELNDKIIAIPKGYVQAEYIRNKYPYIKILEVSSLLEGIDAILLNKADALISNTPTVNYLIHKYNISGISAQFRMDYKSSNLHMATNKKSIILRDIIQKSLNNITDLEKNKITDKWINPINSSNLLNLTNEEEKFLSNNKRIYVGTELDFKPYDFNENNTAKGYSIDYIKLLFSKLNIIPIFVPDKWTTLTQKFKDKEIDVLPIISFNKDREEFISFTKPYLKQTMCIVTKSNTYDIINLDDLKNKKIATGKGWNITKQLKKYHPEIKLLEFNSLHEIFEAVKDGSADGTIQDYLLANYFIKTNYVNKLKIANSITLKNHMPEFHIGVRKDFTILQKILDKAMKTISDKEKENLNNKWINITSRINFTNEEKEFIENTTIKASSTDSWAPFNFIDKKDNRIYGISYDYWQYIVDKAKLKSDVNLINNFSDVLSNLKSKKIDLVIGTSKTPDREEYSIFSNVYKMSPLGIATLKDENFIQNANYLIGKKVGVGKNYTSHKLLEKNFPGIDFVFIKNINEGLELLSENKIFALVDIMPVLTYNISKYGYTNIKITGHTGLDYNLSFMIRDDYKVLQSIINKVLFQMTLEEKEKIQKKWISVEYSENFDYSLIWKIVLFFSIIIFFVIYKNRQLVLYQNKLETTQSELKASLDNFKALINSTIEGILIIKDKKIVYMNDEINKMFEYKDEELINQSIDKIFDKHSKYNINYIIKNSKGEAYESNAINKNNNYFPIYIKCKSLVYEKEIAHIISIVNLTEIKEKENLIMEQSKLASLGEMIGNIAHQWRQPLNAISISASGAKFQKEFDLLNDENFINSMDTIIDTTQFLSQTIDDFQNYIKDDKIKAYFEISASVQKILNIMKGTFINNDIQMFVDIEDRLSIDAYQNELNQVLLNLLNNSKDALKENNIPKKMIHIKSYKEEKNICIEVIDNAGGVPENIINKVFEPYFTTKDKSQGTGLGLYMTHKIINESMKGSISIINTEHTFKDKSFDKCTKVKIILPVS